MRPFCICAQAQIPHPLSRMAKPPRPHSAHCPNQRANMAAHYPDRRKIDPPRGATLGDGTPNDNDRIEIGPTQLAFRELEAAGLTLPKCANTAGSAWSMPWWRAATAAC